MRLWLGTCFALLFCAALAAAEEGFPWLSELDAAEDVKASGKRLVELPYGLHALEPAEPNASELFVGVHGWRSEGYEWVFPLQEINDDSRHMYFFNWNTNEDRCQLAVIEEIQEAIQAELNDQPSYTSVSVIGHSLGGMVVAQLSDAWRGDVPLTIHAVAAPLAYLNEPDDEACPRALPQRQRKDVRFIQWRTRIELDNAFNRLDQNPMIVDILDSIVVELPETYRDRRLGHNWSISYVAEEIASSEAE